MLKHSRSSNELPEGEWASELLIYAIISVARLDVLLDIGQCTLLIAPYLRIF